MNTTFNKRILPQKCLAQVIGRHENCICEKEVIQESFCRGRQKEPKVQHISKSRKRVSIPVTGHGRNRTPTLKKRSKEYRIHKPLSFKKLTICCHRRDQSLYLTSTSSAPKASTGASMHKIIHNSSGISKKESL